MLLSRFVVSGSRKPVIVASVSRCNTRLRSVDADWFNAPALSDPLQHAFENHRIGWRTGNGIDADFTNGTNKTFSPPDPKRNNGRPGLLKRYVIGHTAHPHLIIEAMNNSMLWTQTSGSLTTPANDFGDLGYITVLPWLKIFETRPLNLYAQFSR